MALERNVMSYYVLSDDGNHPHTCIGEYNIGEIDGDTIYFPLYDFATQTILPRKVKFTYSEFQTLSIFNDYNTTTHVLKKWFYNMVNRHSPNNGMIQPMYRSMPGNDKTLTYILLNRRIKDHVVCFRNGIKFDYTTGNYYIMPISDYNMLNVKPVSLLSVTD